MAFNFFVYPPSYQVVPDMMAAAAASNPHPKWPNNNNIIPQHRHDHNDDDGDALLRLVREREGRCPDCGAQTHRLHYGSSSSAAVTVHKEPLTVEKEVHQGRCLLCHPFTDGHLHGGRGSVFPEYGSGAPQQQAQQQTHAISQEEEEEEDEEEPTLQQSNDDNDDDEILNILCRMRRHLHDLQIQISAFHTLWVLSWETENARAIGRVGGIPILLESLRYHLLAHLSINNRYNRNHHTSSPSAVRQMQLQSNGLATLQNLSVNKYNKELLMGDAQGFIPLLLLSMSTFLHNAEIQRSGCHALANILSNGGCYKFNILSNGGLEAVSKSAEMHKNNEGVVRAAYKCLCLLGQKPSRREFAQIEKGGKGDVTDGEGSVNQHVGGEEDTLMLVDMDTSARSAQSSNLDEL